VERSLRLGEAAGLGPLHLDQEHLAAVPDQQIGHAGIVESTHRRADRHHRVDDRGLVVVATSGALHVPFTFSVTSSWPLSIRISRWQRQSAQ
jgi:hypothetical protein